MLQRLVNIVACILVALVGLGAAVMYFTSKPSEDEPKVNRPVAKAPPPRPVKPAEPPAVPTTPVAEPPAETGPGAPNPTKQYTWAEVEEELDSLRPLRATKFEARDHLASWYNYLADPHFTRSPDYPAHLSKLEVFVAQSPQSPTPLIVLAKAHLRYAWQLRGTALDNAVSDESRQQFSKEAAKAQPLLARARELGVKDGEAYALSLQLARIEKNPLAETRAIFDEGCAFDPIYISLYEELATYLLPRWYGQPGDVERFAAEMAKGQPGDDGLDIYLHIAYVVNQYDSNLLYWGNFDRKLLVQAAEVAVQRYPTAPNLVPFAALCTVVAQDRDVAKRVRPAVKHNDAPRVWEWGLVAAEFLQWCDNKESPPGQTQWVWGAPLNYPPVRFTADSRSVWCPTGFGAVAVARWDLPDKKSQLAFSAPASRVQKLAIHPSNTWLAATLLGDKLTGWAVWNVTKPDDEPFIQRSAEACRAIAFHPQLPQLAWADEKQIKTIDISTKAEGPTISTSDEVLALTYSPDGKLLAASGQSFSVWNASTRKKSYDLTAVKSSESEFVCEKILDFDEESRVWAIGFLRGSSPLRRSLVQFAADGKSWQTVIDNLSQQPKPIQPFTAVLSPRRDLLAMVEDSDRPGENEKIQVWDVASQKLKLLLSGHIPHTDDLSFSPDSKFLAISGHLAGAVELWPIAASQK